ncbi:MAG TPA: hypothetical protein VGZ52_05280 [Acidimicrobiales bacterium]|jgi:hypothetical protein|nr:hypothetical protein [Acidimicrobiales bacterium]
MRVSVRVVAELGALLTATAVNATVSPPADAAGAPSFTTPAALTGAGGGEPRAKESS